MPDPREPNQFDFPCTDDSPLNTGTNWRDEEDLYLDEVPLDQDENNWWDDLDWMGD